MSFSSLLQSVGTKVATGLAKAVAGETGEAVVGGLLTAILNPAPDVKPGEVAAQGKNLQGIEDQLTKMQSYLEGQFSEIKAALDKLGKSILYTTWNTSNVVATGATNVINNEYKFYTRYAAEKPGQVNKKDVDDLATDILNANNGASEQMLAIHKLITPDAGSGAKSILTLWTEMTIPVLENGAKAYTTAISDYFSYYVWLVAAQQKAGVLLIEAYNYHQSPKIAEEMWDDYLGFQEAQAADFLRNVDLLLWAAIKGNFPPSSSSGKPVTTSILPLMSEFWPGSFKDSYSPSWAHSTAEQVLCDAVFSSQPEKRRFVVYMRWLCPGAHTSVQLQDIYRTLKLPMTANGKDVLPTSSSTFPFVPPSISIGADIGYTRFVYDVDGDTVGKLVNINGKDGLVPMDDYFSRDGKQPKVVFQDEASLSYVLNVNPSEQVAFMDFTGYQYLCAAYGDLGTYQSLIGRMVVAKTS
jgi:hypothetical protein